MLSAIRCLNRIQIPSLVKTGVRDYMKTSDNMALLLKQADRVPFKCDLVYRHKNYKMAGIMYHTVNFLTCVTVTSACYHVYHHGFNPNPDMPDIIKMFTDPIQTVTVLIGTIAMVIMASVVRSRYVIRIYFNDKNKRYTAIFIGKFPFAIEHHDFPAACLTYVSRNSVLPWKNTLFNANGRKIMLFEENFRTQGDFYDMLHPAELENSNL